MIEKNILKVLNRFNSTNKIDNYNKGGSEGGKVGKKERKNPEATTEQVKI